MRWLWHPNAQASQPAPSAFRTHTATRHMRVLRRACAALLLRLLGPRLERASHAHASSLVAACHAIGAWHGETTTRYHRASATIGYSSRHPSPLQQRLRR
jgi:hypothetical protein